MTIAEILGVLAQYLQGNNINYITIYIMVKKLKNSNLKHQLIRNRYIFIKDNYPFVVVTDCVLSSAKIKNPFCYDIDEIPFDFTERSLKALYAVVTHLHAVHLVTSFDVSPIFGSTGLMSYRQIVSFLKNIYNEEN